MSHAGNECLIVTTHPVAYVAPMTDLRMEKVERKRWYSSLFVQLLVAIVAGIAVGSPLGGPARHRPHAEGVAREEVEPMDEEIALPLSA